VLTDAQYTALARNGRSPFGRVTPIASGIARAFSPNLGTLICDWSVSPTGTASTTDVYPEPIYPAPAVAQCNGAGTNYYCTTNVAAQSSDFAAIGVWAKASTRADGQPYSYARLDLGTDNTFANRALCALTVRADGKWRFYVLPRALWGTSGTFTLGTTTFNNVRLVEQGGATALTLTGAPSSGATSATLTGAFGGTSEIYPVRFSNNDVRMCVLTNGSTAISWGTGLSASATTSIVYATTRLAAQTGDTIQAGPVRRDPQSRAFAMIRLDDGTLDQYVARQTLATPYVGDSGVTIAAGVAHSALTLCQAFGLTANCFILTRHVGNTSANFMTVAQLRDLQDTYGWVIGIQSANNPIASNNVGLRLLGEYGYHLKQTVYGSIASIAGNVVTTTNVHRIVRVSGPSGTQGYPVTIIGPTPPASTLSVGSTVWLREGTTSTFTMHPTETDANNNTNTITLDVGGTSWDYRYSGSTVDGSGVLADLTTAQAQLQAWGLNGWRHYAMNQGAYDQVVEAAVMSLQAADSLRLVQGIFGSSGTGSATYAPRPIFCTGSGGIGFVGGGQEGTSYGSWINGSIAIGTENVTEANIRAAVQSVIARGGVVSNYHHAFANETSMRRFIAYLDELKLRQDQGLLQVVNADELYALTQDAGAL
jgi:hypothetical protein